MTDTLPVIRTACPTWCDNSQCDGIEHWKLGASIAASGEPFAIVSTQASVPVVSVGVRYCAKDGDRTPNVNIAVEHDYAEHPLNEVSFRSPEARQLARALIEAADAIDAEERSAATSR